MCATEVDHRKTLCIAWKAEREPNRRCGEERHERTTHLINAGDIRGESPLVDTRREGGKVALVGVRPGRSVTGNRPIEQVHTSSSFKALTEEEHFKFIIVIRELHMHSERDMMAPTTSYPNDPPGPTYLPTTPRRISPAF